MEKSRKRGRQYVLRLLTIKDRTRSDLINRLKRKGFDDGIIDAIITEMEALGYVNDEKYAMHFANMRATYSLFGPRRVFVELRNHGIPKNMAENAVREVFQEGKEEANALELAKRWISRKNISNKEKTMRRLYAYLERRGFRSDIIGKTIKQVLT
ncbi:MAG: RecX family transcriptional regulator [Firmicutes bacterium]|nr:RecX family transcriptional regulator [Bacillota bacterium]